MQARLRGHCVETAWLDLSSWPFTALGEGQKPEGAGGEARGGGGLGEAPMKKRKKAVKAVKANKRKAPTRKSPARKGKRATTKHYRLKVDFLRT